MKFPRGKTTRGFKGVNPVGKHAIPFLHLRDLWRPGYKTPGFRQGVQWQQNLLSDQTRPIHQALAENDSGDDNEQARQATRR